MRLKLTAVLLIRPIALDDRLIPLNPLCYFALSYFAFLYSIVFIYHLVYKVKVYIYKHQNRKERNRMIHTNKNTKFAIQGKSV